MGSEIFVDMIDVVLMLGPSGASTDKWYDLACLQKTYALRVHVSNIQLITHPMVYPDYKFVIQFVPGAGHGCHVVQRTNLVITQVVMACRICHIVGAWV